MTISANTQAILLLTARFGKADPKGGKPLTTKEYGRFAEWMKLQSYMPEQLLERNVGELLNGWHDRTVTIDRVSALLERGQALAISMEKWLRAGLWVMTRSDPDYPRRLKQRLKGDSPAVFFGCGNRALLNAGGLAVVGSRNVSDQDLRCSSRIGRLAAEGGRSIISGGARGVDETSMLGALDAEGTSVGVLADSLLRACSSRKYHRALMSKDLVLVSPFNPEAGFNTGNAMARNKYIYCLADAALVVHSGITGGTWTGAHENLKQSWVPLWVKRSDDPDAGNLSLIKAGGREVSAELDGLNIGDLFKASVDQPGVHDDLFSEQNENENQPPIYEEVAKTATVSKVTNGNEAAGLEAKSALDEDIDKLSFYQIFVRRTVELCADHPVTPDDLINAFGLGKSQLNAWLKKAVEDGYLQKKSKPVRYGVGFHDEKR